jgi:Protein of unknown function (DUF5672)
MKKRQLADITLLSVSSINLNNTIYALWRSSRRLDFAAIKLIGVERPKRMPKWLAFEVAQDNLLKSINDYSHYCLYNLWRHVDTPFCLKIHADGYVINPKKWDDDFLKWDYIGAPWQIRGDAYIDPFGNHQRVGNGGFNLRSKKVLEVPLRTHIEWNVNQSDYYKHMGENNFAEDGNICVHNRHIFEASGVKFAPLDIALKFSVEQKVLEYRGVKTFGYHKNLPTIGSFIIDKFWRTIFQITRLTWKR